MAADLPLPTDALAAHPLVWRGRQSAHRVQTQGTGHDALDRALPGGGWPRGAVTEIIHAAPGCGELSLLLPLLARLSRQGQRLVMIDPPWIPYPPALQDHGLDLERLMLVRTPDRKASLWACEQVVRGMPGGAMLAWPDAIAFGEVRRLQLAATESRKTVFLFRGPDSIAAASPASLRLEISADDRGLRARILKCRGRRPASGIRIKAGSAAAPWRANPGLSTTDGDHPPPPGTVHGTVSTGPATPA